MRGIESAPAPLQGLGVELKDRIRAVREALKLTQEQVADAGGFERVEASNTETGRNKLTSHRLVVGFARGFGLPLQAMSDLVEGAIDVEKALETRAALEAGQDDKANEKTLDPRAIAAGFARANHIREDAIRDIMSRVQHKAVPQTPEQWFDRMKARGLELDEADAGKDVSAGRPVKPGRIAAPPAAKKKP